MINVSFWWYLILLVFYIFLVVKNAKLEEKLMAEKIENGKLRAENRILTAFFESCKKLTGKQGGEESGK